MTRARWTIVWPTGRALRRADRTRSGELTLHSVEQPDTEDLGLLVDTALRLAPNPGRELLVLDPRVTARPVELDAAACAGLADDDLNLAIAFELESLVGLNPPDAALASLELAASPGARRRLALALPKSRLESAVTAAARFGVRRVAITSPHALPRPILLEGEGGASGDRLELWEEGLARWSFSPDGEAGFVWRDTDPALGLMEESAESRAGVLTVSALDSDPVGLEEGGPVLRLEQPEDARRWLGVWFEALAAGDLCALRPPAKPLGVRARAAISATLLILAILACGGAHAVLSQRIDAAKAATESAKAPAAQLAKMKASAATLTKERDQLRATVKALEESEAQATRVFERTRKRWPRLLGALARHMSGDMILTELRSAGRVVEVVGIEVRVGSAGELSALLARDLGPLGWHVSPAAERIRDDGRRDFTLRIGEQVSAGDSLSPVQRRPRTGRAGARARARRATR